MHFVTPFVVIHLNKDPEHYHHHHHHHHHHHQYPGYYSKIPPIDSSIRQRDSTIDGGYNTMSTTAEMNLTFGVYILRKWQGVTVSV
jgi:hypothetical protein